MEDAFSEKTRFISDMLGRYADMVFRLALMYLQNRADAEDAVQEVFLRLYRAKTTFNGEEHVKAWLLKVTANYCRSLLRSPWHRRVTVTQTFLNLVEDGDKRTVVREVLSLPEKYREVMYLFYYEGYSTAEIARLLAEKEPTVRTRLRRGRALLKPLLKEDLENEI